MFGDSGIGKGAGLGQGPAKQVVAVPAQHSPEQVAFPSPEVQDAALALMIHKLLAPPRTATRANGNTALSIMRLIKPIALSPFRVKPGLAGGVKPAEPA
jgi:hypothetical protein